jgi:hypothetical protein
VNKITIRKIIIPVITLNFNDALFILVFLKITIGNFHNDEFLQNPLLGGVGVGIIKIIKS